MDGELRRSVLGCLALVGVQEAAAAAAEAAAVPVPIAGLILLSPHPVLPTSYLPSPQISLLCSGAAVVLTSLPHSTKARG